MRDAPVATHAKQVPGDHRKGHQRQPEHVPGVEPQQRRSSDALATDDQPVQGRADPGDLFQQIGANQQRPARVLVPAQNVASKVQ